jgi:transposase
VRGALESDSPPKYEREPAGSIVDAVESRIRELLQAYPTMPATVIAERIGWTRSIRVLSGRVAELRPAYLPPDPRPMRAAQSRGKQRRPITGEGPLLRLRAGCEGGAGECPGG